MIEKLNLMRTLHKTLTQPYMYVYTAMHKINRDAEHVSQFSSHKEKCQLDIVLQFILPHADL